MASNQIGNCTIKPGSALVSFDDNAIMNDMVAGDLFRIVQDSVFFTIASVNLVNKTCTLTSRYSNSLYQAYAIDETIAESDGTNVFSVTLGNSPVIPGTAMFADGSNVETFIDNGDGILTGSDGGSGTISYDDGVVALTFNSVVPDGVAVVATEYSYGVELSQVPFQIVRDYTTYFEWPEPHASDQDAHAITRQALRLIDNDLRNGAAQVFFISAFDSDVSVSTGDGKNGFTIPYHLDGYAFTDAIASVHTKGVTGTTTVQVRKLSDGSNIDLLSPRITIGDEYYARDGSAIVEQQLVAVGDRIYVDVDTVHSGTAPKGLSVSLTFQKM